MFGPRLGSTLNRASRPQLIFTRYMLLAVGAVDLWTAIAAQWLFFQVGAAVIAAIVFMCAGIIWERYTPTLADEIARNVYGADNALDLIIRMETRKMAVTREQEQEPGDAG